MQKATRSRFTFNLIASVFAQLLRYGAPLALYPYLTRTLGAASFAEFALAFAAAMMLGQLIEFGFGLSGGRALAAAPTEPEAAAAVAGDILVGRLVTAAATLAGALVLLALVPVPSIKDPRLIAALALLAVAYGFSSTWYFVGRERAAFLAGLEILTSFGQFGLLVWLVRGPVDAWLPILVMSLPVWIVAITGHLIAYFDIGLRLPSLPRLLEKLVESFRFFCFTGIMPLLNRGALIILGAMAEPAQVAYYAVGERIVTAAGNATIPIVRVGMPRITALLAESGSAARRLFVRMAGGMSVLALAGAVVGAVLSPWGVPFVFGQDIAPGAPIIMVQLFIVPALIAGRLGGTLGLVPLRQDKLYQRAVLATAFGGIALAPLAIWAGGAMGLACARLATELVLALVVWLMLSKQRILGPSPLATR